MESTAVIIGAGLGGLFTGAILAREGVKVTLIEKNPTCGGGLQSFTRMGEVFDTGMHIVGGMKEGGNIFRICKYLGISDKLHLKHVDEKITDCLFYAEDGKFYNIAQGREAYVDSLASYFPQQRANLEAYVKAIYDIVDELDLFYLRPSKPGLTMHGEDFLLSANAFIDKYISDPKLAVMLAYMNPLYGGVKDKTPAFIHALIAALYINGPTRFAGGSQLFADTLKDRIIELGGEVILGDGVKKIFTQDKVITGVETRKGRRFQADWYISAIHPCTLFELFDNQADIPKAYRHRLDSLPNAYSAFTLNIKLKPDTFPYLNYSCYYMDRYEDIWGFSEPAPQWPLGFLFMTPPALEQGEYASKVTITAPMLWEDVKKWEGTTLGHRTDDYEQWKKECTEKILVRIENMYPGFRECIEGINTASPLTIRDWYGVKEGSMCGFSKDCNNMTESQVPVVTKIRNLLLTGQNCNVHGFCGVPLTAMNTADVILGLNHVVNHINELEKEN